MRQVIESCVSSIRVHSPMNISEIFTSNTMSSLKFYMLPWVDIKRGFRVFVFECRITAISQQKLY